MSGRVPGKHGATERAELCSRTDGTGEKSEHFILLLSPPVLAALNMWENYKPTCCVMLFFFPPLPHKICHNRIGQGTFHFLMPDWPPPSSPPRRVIIMLAVNWRRRGFRSHTEKLTSLQYNRDTWANIPQLLAISQGNSQRKPAELELICNSIFIYLLK